jgi:glutathionylspermidine synthase
MHSSKPLFNGSVIDYDTTPVTLKKADSQKIETSFTDLLKKIEDFTTQSLKDVALLKRLGVEWDFGLSPTAFGLHMPFARFDFAFDKNNQPKIFELNTDGTSGWNVAEWVNDKASQEGFIATKNNPNFKLSERLLEGILKHAPKTSKLILLDFSGGSTEWEQADLLQRWNQMGNKTVIRKSPLEEDWEEGALVYRRAVSWELKKYFNKCGKFIEAWKKNKITVVGSFSSDVGMSKIWPAFVSSPLVAETHLLNDETIKKVRDNKDEWILKKAFSLAGRGVLSGTTSDLKQWKEAVSSGSYEIAQRRVEMCDETQGKLELGLYFINAKPAGYLCRKGHTGMITETSNDVTTALQILD